MQRDLSRNFPEFPSSADRLSWLRHSPPRRRAAPSSAEIAEKQNERHEGTKETKEREE
jgi:hypothetical protein